MDRGQGGPELKRHPADDYRPAAIGCAALVVAAVLVLLVVAAVLLGLGLV